MKVNYSSQAVIEAGIEDNGSFTEEDVKKLIKTPSFKKNHSKEFIERMREVQGWDKISVIIPTLNPPDTFIPQLKKILDCDVVGEVIIIDNSQEFEYEHPKLTIKRYGENIYVNPSWNEGVKLAKNERICLCNDDIVFDTEVFNFIKSKITEDVNLIGLSLQDHEPELKLEETKLRGYGYGCLMFIHRDRYKLIPNWLLVYHGDDFLFMKGRPNYVIKGLDVGGSMQTTARNFSEVAKQDESVFKEFVKRLQEV